MMVGGQEAGGRARCLSEQFGAQPAGLQPSLPTMRYSPCGLLSSCHQVRIKATPSTAKGERARLGLTGACVDCMLLSTSSTRDRLKSVTLHLQTSSTSCSQGWASRERS